jgi:glucose/arabinose dehydrogenase
VATAIAPDYSLGSHVAPLGLCTSEGARLTPAFASGMFVGLHGSWNRKPKSGYKVVFVPFSQGRSTPMASELRAGRSRGRQWAWPLIDAAPCSCGGNNGA